MSALSQVRLFLDRRIGIPVGPDDLVLDVGSGDKPSWRADVLLDRYPTEEYAGQRSGSRRARVSRPLFDADAADMPFADGAFDYTICSNLLEHVDDPAAVINELTRVSSAGYIEVPDVGSAKIVDFPSHVWWCRLDKATDPPVLVFEPKSSRWDDSDIAEYFTRTGLQQRVAKVLDSRFEDRVIMLHWQGAVSHRVEGEVSGDFYKRALSMPGHPRNMSARLVQLATDVVTWRQQKRIRRRRIRFDDVVKPEFRRHDGSLLTRQVYQLGRTSGSVQ